MKNGNYITTKATGRLYWAVLAVHNLRYGNYHWASISLDQVRKAKKGEQISLHFGGKAWGNIPRTFRIGTAIKEADRLRNQE